MPERIIAHADNNSFYPSVEMLRNPRYRHIPMAVCGDIKERKGIVMSSNYPAKIKGVKAGMAIRDHGVKPLQRPGITVYHCKPGTANSHCPANRLIAKQ